MLRPYMRPNVGIYIILTVACLAVAALLPAFNWAVTGDPLTNTYTLWWPYDTVGFGPAAGRPDGHTLELGLVNVRLDLAAFQTAFLGWPAPLGVPLAALPLLLGLFLAPRSRRDLLLLLVPVLLVAAHIAYWARAGEYYGGRYYSEGMPFLWLLAARGLLKFSRGRIRGFAVRVALPAAVLYAVAAEIGPRFADGRGMYDVTRRGPDIVAAANLHNALVFVRLQAWTDYAEFSWLNSPFLDGDVVYARDLGPEADAEIIAAFPGRAVYCYDERRTEQPLAKYEPSP